jgi:hypothetical protein
MSIAPPTHADASSGASAQQGQGPGKNPQGRARRMVAPLATIGGLAAATTLLAVVDPNEPGHYPICPTKYLLGVDCPGCGGLRATHDLAHGDIAGALDHNAFFVLAVPVILYFLARWVWHAWRGTQPRPWPPRLTRGLLIAAAALLCVFTVVRNIPFGGFLGAGLS